MAKLNKKKETDKKRNRGIEIIIKLYIHWRVLGAPRRLGERLFKEAFDAIRRRLPSTVVSAVVTRIVDALREHLRRKDKDM